MSGHSPGPWRVEEYQGDVVLHVLDAKGRDIIRLVEAADARLIAAAPELLSALSWALSCLEADGYDLNEDDDARDFRDASALVARIEGKEGP